jgi:putative endonuclease
MLMALWQHLDRRFALIYGRVYERVYEHAARVLSFSAARGRIDETRVLGNRGEKLAAKLLRRKGYLILGRNVRVPMGEADLVCEHPGGEAIVVVEVKTRTRGVSEASDSYAPEAAVDPAKRAKLRTIASHLARANGWMDRPVWLDVVAVEWPAGDKRPTLRHIERVPW